jgi:diguanylate cyclase (GGDEF)-like protein/PAS domain S-box-containing protein
MGMTSAPELTQHLGGDTASGTNAGSADARNREEQILEERVRLLYEQAPMGILSTLVVACITAYVQLGTAPTALVAGWFLGHLVLNALRLALLNAYKGRRRAAVPARRWALWYTLGSGLSGLAWGCSVLLLAHSDSVSHHYFVAIVVGGIASGAVAILSVVFAAYLAFAVLTLLPVAVWFMLQGNTLYPLVGLLGVLLLGVMLFTAKRLHDNVGRSLDLSAANAELAKTVSVAWDEAIKINRELEHEIAARRRIESWLTEEKERAQVTLQSIGDAVITTDVHCRIDYLNPVAADLTGWPLGHAHGRPFEEIFRLRDEPRGRERGDPVRHCLSEAVTHGFGDGKLLRRDDSNLHVQYSWAPIRDRNGELSGSVLVFRAITEPHADEPSFEASHDPLTGLMNRPGMEQRLDHALETALTHKLEHVLVSLTLAGLEPIEASGAEEAVKRLLRQFSHLLQRHVRDADAVGRVDEGRFLLLLESCSLQSAQSIVDRVRRDVDDFRFSWGEQTFKVGLDVEMHPLSPDSDLGALLGP